MLDMIEWKTERNMWRQVNRAEMQSRHDDATVRRVTGTGLHSLTSKLNLRIFGTHCSRQISTCAPSGRIHGLYGGQSKLKLSGKAQSKLKLSGNGNECEPLVTGEVFAQWMGSPKQAVDLASVIKSLADKRLFQVRGLHSVPIQLNLCSSVHRITRLSP